MTRRHATTAGLHICIGLITRGRPNMLRRCLQSFARMATPPDVNRLTFVIVENNAELTISPLVQEFRDTVKHQVICDHETRLGIPMARNKVLDLALGLEADFLTFIDDDELVHPDWLSQLWQTHRDGDYDLTGGPVGLAPLEEPNTWSQRVIHRGLAKRYGQIADRAKKRSLNGDDHKNVVSTNNWMLSLETQRASGIRFDESLGASGGSDAIFFSHARASGFRTGWAADAWVEEIMPKSRLSFSYQFLRGADQTLVTAHHKNQSRPLIVNLASTFVYCCERIAVSIIRLVIAPFQGGASLMQAARSLGCAYGRIRALWKPATNHYQNVHGD